VPQDAFFKYGHKLAPDLAKRARHFFTESDRVREGIDAWRAGQLERFGRLMAASCQSSIEQYECGSPAIHDLQQVVASAKGVIGSRFSGGGFGGCVVGLIQPATAVAAVADIHETYKKLHPEVADQSRVYLAGSAEGVRFI
jgi:galactokinase